jgi:hypothetical protein
LGLSLRSAFGQNLEKLYAPAGFTAKMNLSKLIPPFKKALLIKESNGARRRYLDYRIAQKPLFG